MTAHPYDVLRSLAQLALALGDNWTTYEHTEALLATPPGSPTSAGGGGTGRSTGVPDPTYATVTGHQRYYDTAATIAQAQTLLRKVQRTMDQVLQQHPTIAGRVEAAIRAARCSGEIDPLCVRNAVTREGLCSACYQRKRRAAS